MHDLASARIAYDDQDTVVLDDPDEVVMHVLVPTAVGWAAAGARHKRIPNGTATSCALPIDRFAVPLREELTGDLCPRCFTEFERTLAADADKAAAIVPAVADPTATSSNGHRPTLRGLAVQAVFPDRRRRRTAIPKLKK